MPRVARRIRYGASRGQVADLWLPQATHPPVVLLVHGGFWRAQYTKVLMRPLARAATERGWAAWNVEYRRVGWGGGGGGWPTTLADVASAVDALVDVEEVDSTRVVACGHSAGGHLALWSAARHRFPQLSPSGSGHGGVALRGVVSLAGVVDLIDADRRGLGGDAVAQLLGGHYPRWPERYRSASPAELLPLGVPQILVHGARDTIVPPDVSRRYAEAAGRRGDQVELIELETADHRALIAPSRTGDDVLGAVGRLLED
jgi:acetyl esterase/lipase